MPHKGFLRFFQTFSALSHKLGSLYLREILLALLRRLDKFDLEHSETSLSRLYLSNITKEGTTMLEKFLEKQNLSRREKLAFFRSMLKREMDVMNEYCVMNLPTEYRAELCHIENIKKLLSPATSGDRRMSTF
jgi:hypothetical protein